MTPFRLGFTTVTFRKKTPEEILLLAKENGIRFIEWGTDVHVPTIKAAEEVRRLAEAADIRAMSLGAYYRVGVTEPSSFSQTLEIARILGAPRIRLWLGNKSSHLYTSEERARMIEEVRTLLAMARPYHIELAFEFHRKTLNDTGESALAFLKDVGDASLSTYWQPFFHETPEADFPFEIDRQNLLTVLPHVSATHVFSWDEAANRFPFAHHRAPWKAFLSVLKDSPCHDLIMEFVVDDSEEQFKEDLAVLRKILEEIA